MADRQQKRSDRLVDPLQPKNPANKSNPNRPTQLYGCRKTPDHIWATMAVKTFHLSKGKTTLPAICDLRNQCPPVLNQGDLGSCVSNSVGSLFYFDELKQKIKNPINPSRLFLYYNVRVIEHTVGQDAGATVYDAITSVKQTGLCDEKLWPYNIAKFKVKPSAQCYTAAKQHVAKQYKAIIQNLDQLKQCLADGFPFSFGFLVYSSFESSQVAQTGVMPIPGPKEQNYGGHCVMAVGYDDTRQVFIVRNSWGTDWGDKGYFYMPYQYIVDPDKCWDFWTITQVS